MVTIGLVAHEDYLDNLGLIISLWDSFAPKEWGRFIALDGCKTKPYEGWTTLTLPKTGSPSKPRNEILNQLTSGRVIFWDADNVPTKEFVEELIQVSQLESPIFAFYPNLRPPKDLRLLNHIDTASLVSVEMLKSIGGWDEELECVEDWELFLRAKAHGFLFEPLESFFVYNKHPLSRNNKPEHNDCVSRIRSLGIICLFRGDRTLTKDWLRSLNSQTLITKTGLTVIDKSGDPSFAAFLKRELLNLDLNRVTYVKDECITSQDFNTIHNSVGKSYALALQSTPEDLILTWEDDVIPTDNGVSEIVSLAFPLSPYHVVAGHVPLRDNPSKLIAALSKEKWDGCIAPPDELISIGQVGGGFTLYHRAVLEEFGFQGMRYIGDFPAGWDGWLCRRINSKYKIGLAPIKCRHER